MSGPSRSRNLPVQKGDFKGGEQEVQDQKKHHIHDGTGGVFQDDDETVGERRHHLDHQGKQVKLCEYPGTIQTVQIDKHHRCDQGNEPGGGIQKGGHRRQKAFREQPPDEGWYTNGQSGGKNNKYEQLLPVNGSVNLV